MTAAVDEGQVSLGRACRALASLKWNLLRNGLRGRMQLRIQTWSALVASVLAVAVLVGAAAAKAPVLRATAIAADNNAVTGPRIPLARALIWYPLPSSVGPARRPARVG